MARKASTSERLRRYFRLHPRQDPALTNPTFRHKAGTEERAEIAFGRQPEPRSAGERHAEREAFRGPGTEEQRIARMNEAREAFTGTRMSRGRGIGKEVRRTGRRRGRR